MRKVRLLGFWPKANRLTGRSTSLREINLKTNILFVAEKPTERSFKISYALRKRGISTSVLYRTSFEDQDFGRYFDFVRIEPDINEIARIAARQSADFVHLNTFCFDNVCTEILLGSGKKVIYDPKDVFPGVAQDFGIPKNVLDAQQYLLQHAHALIMRDGGAHLSSQLLKFSLTRRRLFFPDFCWSSDFFPKIIKSKRDIDIGNIKFVIIGNFYSERQFPHFAGAGQIYVVEAILKAGHSLDIFPSKFNIGHDLSDYERLGKSFPGRLKIHSPLSEYNLITQALPAYDVGLNVSQAVMLPRLPQYLHPRMYTYCGSTRVFDYLTAGLHIGLDYKQFKVAFRKVGFNILNLESFAESIQKYFQAAKFGDERRYEMRELSIDKYIDKLIDFYRRV